MRVRDIILAFALGVILTTHAIRYDFYEELVGLAFLVLIYNIFKNLVEFFEKRAARNQE